MRAKPSTTTVLAVHGLAALFWLVIAMVAGEMSIVLTVIFGTGALIVGAGAVLLLRRHPRARSFLITGDLVPAAAGLLIAVWVVQDSLRQGGFGDLVMQSGAALSLYLPITIAPLALALALPREANPG